ncbi:MAG: NADPH-dependent 2,4-dienoyl-CoA reductase, partial [Hyphomicrobiales bacterium]|nr:NADPH-dependent 2,4-dienoyl-CoA reductase [Hyphomicrobiales bacterium]
GVQFINGVEYLKIDDDGLHVLVDDEPTVFDVDTIILCTGQTPDRELYDAVIAEGLDATLIGGAYEAAELDAKRAINQASYLAAAV